MIDLWQKFILKNSGWSTGVVNGLGPYRWSMDWGCMFCIGPSWSNTVQQQDTLNLKGPEERNRMVK